MNYIKHYIKDNDIVNYETISDFEKSLIKYRTKLIASYINKKKPMNVLDIGNGHSLLENFVHTDYFSIDISQKNNKSKFKITGDSYYLPFKNHSFDFIVISEVLEHLEFPEKAIKEINRVLKENGKLIITVPYKEKIQYHLCIHCNKLTPANAHLHSFDEKKIKDLLINTLKIKEIHLFENKLLYIFHFFEKTKNFYLQNFFDGIAKIIKNKYNKILVYIEKGR